MASRTKATRRVVTSRTRERAPSTSKAGRIELLLEEIRAQNRATIEAVEAQGVALGARIDALRDDLCPRVSALELAVRHNSQDIRGLQQSVDTLTGRVDTLTERVDTLTGRVDTLTERVDTLTNRVDNLSDRMERVETKLDTKAETTVVREINRRVSALERQPPAEA